MKIRIKFSKEGCMKFVGHLDIMRYFQKAMRRANVDMMYSEGFSPHQKMSFAAPLGLGLTSSGEYFDIEVHSTDGSTEMLRRLNDTMVEGMRVLSYVLLPDDSENAMSLVAAADYEITIRNTDLFPIALDEVEPLFLQFMAQPQIEVLKATKKSEKMVDIKPLIYHATMTGTDTKQPRFIMQLASGSVNHLKPELVMDAFFHYCGKEYDPCMIQMKRLELYGERDGIRIPLENYGTEIK